MFLHTFLFVFIAEMADKTQLMMMALTNRYRMITVILGMMTGVLCISAISTLAGDFIGDLIPMYYVKLLAAILFLGFGFFNLKPSHDEKERSISFKFPILSIALTFLIAESGDKTQLATVALAADHMDAHLAIFAGASCGLILANLVGIFAGKMIFSHLHEDVIKVLSSFFFFLFGSITLYEAIPANPFILMIHSIIVVGIAYRIFTRSRRMRPTA